MIVWIPNKRSVHNYGSMSRIDPYMNCFRHLSLLSPLSRQGRKEQNYDVKISNEKERLLFTVTRVEDTYSDAPNMFRALT